jgi:diguanylate cyclase (GGDEF)-like protein
MQLHLRPYDPIVRVGGDEFVCALPDTEPDTADRRFEAIRASMAQAQTDMSISVGLSALRPDDHLVELMERADQALYANKASKRFRRP